MKFACPLDISAHYLKYPPSFTAWCKKRGYLGYEKDSLGRDNVYHKGLFKKLNP